MDDLLRLACSKNCSHTPELRTAYVSTLWAKCILPYQSQGDKDSTAKWSYIPQLAHDKVQILSRKNELKSRTLAC